MKKIFYRPKCGAALVIWERRGNRYVLTRSDFNRYMDELLEDGDFKAQFRLSFTIGNGSVQKNILSENLYDEVQIKLSERLFEKLDNTQEKSLYYDFVGKGAQGYVHDFLEVFSELTGLISSDRILCSDDNHTELIQIKHRKPTTLGKLAGLTGKSKLADQLSKSERRTHYIMLDSVAELKGYPNHDFEIILKQDDEGYGDKITFSFDGEEGMSIRKDSGDPI